MVDTPDVLMGGTTVLIVEDDIEVSRGLTLALENLGCRCVQTPSCIEGLKLFDRLSPEVVLLSLGVDGMPAIEVLKRIKEAAPKAVTVTLAPAGAPQAAVKALKLGADNCFVKPVDVDELTTAVEHLLKRVRYEDKAGGRKEWPGELLDHWMGRLFTDAPAAILHIDPNDKINLLNRRAAELLGVDPEQLLGSSVERIVHENLRTNWLKAVRRNASSQRGYMGETMFRGGDRMFPASVSAVEKPEKNHLLLSFQDLTLQKAIDQHYVEAQKLSSLGRVVEGVAHEVRNPLISIGGFARKLKGMLAEDEKAFSYLEIMLEEVVRLEKMVTEIEDYVEFTVTRSPRFVSINLGSLIRDAVSEISAKRTSSSVRVSMAGLDDGVLSVYGDEKHLLELFTVLVENGFEAMPDGGDLSITLDAIDGLARIRVGDTGVGIEEELMETIFDPFYTSKTSGAGLGLAKAYMIVDEHSGTIQFQSRVGEGTLCTVGLPRDRREISRV